MPLPLPLPLPLLLLLLVLLLLLLRLPTLEPELVPAQGSLLPPFHFSLLPLPSHAPILCAAARAPSLVKVALAQRRADLVHQLLTLRP